MAGKGDKLRPLNKKIYDENFDQIKWNQTKKNLSEIKSSKGKIKIKY